jgi:hypothetical protein
VRRGAPVAARRLRPLLLCAALTASVARADVVEVPVPRAAHDGDALGTAAVATPAARARGFVMPAVPTDAVRLPDGVVAIRFGTALVVGTREEGAAAWTRLASPAARWERFLVFRTIGDLDLREATRLDVARVGADAGRPLDAGRDGWSVVCWTCDGADVMAALQALGARAMPVWQWLRLRDGRR